MDNYHGDKKNSTDSDTKDDLKTSLHMVKNLFLTGDTKKEFQFSDESEDNNGEIKNMMKRSRIYLRGAFLCFAATAFLSMLTMPLNMSHFFLCRLLSGVFSLIRVIGIAGTIYLGYRGFKIRNAGVDSYNANILSKAIEEILPGATFHPKDYVSASWLYQRGICPKFDRSAGSNMVSYQSNGQKCGFSNLKLENVYEDSKGHTHTKTIFNGQAYIVEFKSELPANVRILSTTRSAVLNREVAPGYKKRMDNETKIEVENQVFNDNFDVYATDEESAFYVVSPIVMEHLLELKKQYSKFAVHVERTQIAIALGTNRTLFAPPASYDDIEHISIENSKKEVMDIINFVKTLENSINGRLNRREPN